MTSFRARTSAFFMFALLFLMSTVAAQQPNQEIPLGDKKITISGSIIAIVLMVAGFLFAFFGHRFFRITLFLAGFYVLSTLAWIALSNIEPKDNLWNNREWIYLGAAGAAGIIGGALFLCFWRLGFAAIGAMAGFYLAVFILSWKDSGVITNTVPRVAFIAIFVIIGIILTFFIERHVVIIGTAIAGSGSFFLGLDNFVKTGFGNALNAFLDGNFDVTNYHVTPQVYGMLGGTLAMMVVGACFQYWKHRGSFIPKSHRNQTPAYHPPNYQQV
ncbi:hypothetical protein DFQ27_005531 [Actinomortierella ambigua]|uniref:Transmembrane protein 198 n=1 Tax=Actinomortierella ambigua TaxID=1343610 RepID=A0A9P6Q1W1_9FUNG|nr:hypothetical protein DFQ26_009560 [Actinomortierella ambigua]KAG0256700.1 hypothetical protein DFQ27_005531 [Actinomortierella ambigua]